MLNRHQLDEPKSPAANNTSSAPLTVETVDNHVYFYARVDEDRCLSLIKQLRTLDGQLRHERLSRNLPDDFPATPIWLHIHSYGGWLFAGMGMIEQIRAIPSPVYCVIEGICASAATFLAFACDKCYIQPRSHILIHQFRTWFVGTHEEFKDEMILQERLIEDVAKFYAEISIVSEDEMRDRLKHDYWLDAKQAIEEGFCDALWT